MTRPRVSDPPRKRQRTAIRKQEIARIAARLFAANGYHSTGMSELSEAVGLGKGALYYHIGSKEELLYEISAVHVQEMVAYGEALVAREDLSPVEKVRSLSRMLLQTISDNLPEVTVFFHEVRTLTGERARELMTLRKRFEEIWMQIIDEGVAAGVFRALDPIAIKGILGLHNYSYLWLTPDGRLSPDDISEVFCDMLLNGYLRDDQAAASD